MDTPALEALRTVSGAAEQARALPAACYRDPAFFEAEVERIMRAEWHPVARRDALPEPGDYRSLDLYGEPILLLRDAAARSRSPVLSQTEAPTATALSVAFCTTAQRSSRKPSMAAAWITRSSFR